MRIGLAGNLHRAQRCALTELLDVHFTLTVHFGDQQVRKRIHTGDTYSVQPSRNLIAVLVEFTAGVQHSKYDLEC